MRVVQLVAIKTIEYERSGRQNNDHLHDCSFIPPCVCLVASANLQHGFAFAKIIKMEGVPDHPNRTGITYPKP